MLRDNVVIVTGAKGGLGTFVTEACLNAGAQVAGVSRSIADADFTSDRFRAFPVELGSAEAAQRLVKQVQTWHGRIDAVIHLLGGYAGGHNVMETDDATALQMLQLNFLSAFHLFRAVLPDMRSAGGGRIVAIGSRSAAEASPMSGVYAASKAALVSLVRTVAAENEDRCITANIVLPGTLDTPANRKAMPQADFSRWVQPQRLASLIVGLAGDSLADVNGAAIPVYGRGQ